MVELGSAVSSRIFERGFVDSSDITSEAEAEAQFELEVEVVALMVLRLKLQTSAE